MEREIEKMIQLYTKRYREYQDACVSYPRSNGNDYLDGKAQAYKEMVDDLKMLQSYIKE